MLVGGIHNSSVTDIKFGTSQESVINPILFIIYVIGIEFEVNLSKPVLRAVDLTLVYRSPSYTRNLN